MTQSIHSLDELLQFINRIIKLKKSSGITISSLMVSFGSLDVSSQKYVLSILNSVMLLSSH